MKNFRWSAVLVLAIGACLAGCASTSRNESPMDGHFYCLNVVDGDTIDVDFDGDGSIDKWNERVRLARIDVVEGKSPDNLRAASLLRWLILNREVRVVRGKRDGFSRWIAEVEIGGRNVSDLLLAAGLAEIYRRN